VIGNPLSLNDLHTANLCYLMAFVFLSHVYLQSVVEEHCQHCLKVFPLDELVTHALNCSHRKFLGSLVRSSDIINLYSRRGHH